MSCNNTTHCRTIIIFALLLALFLTTSESQGATITYSFDNIDQAIPDGSPVGWSDRRMITADFAVIQSVTVSLNITGGFNGDLYAQLIHGSGFTVLLNRVGRTAANPLGYTDSGLNVQFKEGPLSAGDVHRYRLTLSGSENTPLGGPLTGIWTPDGRVVDPGLVLDTDSRTASLGSFNGLDPNGEWTLFVADLDGGGQSTVRSWGLTVLGVPEPGAAVLLLASACSWLGVGRFRRGRAQLSCGEFRSFAAILPLERFEDFGNRLFRPILPRTPTSPPTRPTAPSPRSRCKQDGGSSTSG